MKKTFLFLIMAAGLLSCAKEMTPAPEQAPSGVPMSFNITVTGTKAEKTNWANGDVVYVFFKGLEEKYLSLSYDGSKWTTASGGDTLTDTDFNGLTTKTLTAVHLPVAVDVTFADGTFTFTQDGKPVYNYYLLQTGKEYEVDGTTVTATLEMGKPEGFAQFHVAGIPDGAEDYTFSCSRVQPIACSGVSTSGSILTKALDPGAQMRGVDDADGLVFGGRLTVPGRTADYKFVLTGPDKIYKLVCSKALSAGARYNFPVPGEGDWTVAVDLDGKGYDFLHLSYYTFNTGHENNPFIQKLDFADNDGSVTWWTQVNPAYFTEEEATQSSESFRHALAKFDMSYINLAELAFTVVDGEDNILTDDEIDEAGLRVKFSYVDPDLAAMALPEPSRTDDLSTYADLWVDNTVFYYRTNEKKFIPVEGKLFIKVDGEEYELPTRFSRPKASVKNPGEMLDYSSYALVRHTTFKEPVASGFTIVLDENKVYREPLFKGLTLMDNRPNGVTYYVINDGEWIEGNVDEFDALDGTYTTGGNGYINGVLSRDAYLVVLSSDFGPDDIPTELKKLLKIKYSADGEEFVDSQTLATQMPYIVFDYTSEVQFRGTVTLPVKVTIESPWQEPLEVSYDITIKGVVE